MTTEELIEYLSVFSPYDKVRIVVDSNDPIEYEIDLLTDDDDFGNRGITYILAYPVGRAIVNPYGES